MKKNILIICIICCSIYVVKSKTNNSSIYKIDLSNQPYQICGEEVYFSSYAYNDELNGVSIADDINEICNVNGVDNAKDILENLLDDDYSFTRKDIMRELQNAYNYLDK